MSDPDPTDASDRLRRLEDRLRAARVDLEPAPHQETHYAQANLAWRMVIELVAGLSIGFGIGFGLDRLFGTMPIFLILFIFLGLAAGIRTMLRSAREVERKRLAEAAGEKGEGIG